MTLYVTLGVLLGVLTGCIPGVGMLVALTVSYPFLLNSSGIEILCFYTAVLVVSQYMGSVVAITSGIPGEESSMPSIIEGKKFLKSGQIGRAISQTAIGSFFGGIIAAALVYLISSHYKEISKIFTSDVKFLVLVFSIIVMCCIFRNKWYVTAVMLLVGVGLSLVGQDPISHKNQFTLGIDWLSTGIPVMPVMISLFVFPEMYKAIQQSDTVSYSVEYKNQSFTQALRESFSYKWSILRSSALGFVFSLTPGINYVLGTNVSYMVEKYIQGRKDQQDMNSLVAAETANNSGAFSVLIPLMFFGIPISTSQAVLFDMLYERGLYFGSTFMNQITVSGYTYFQTLIFWFIVINIVALIIAWPLSRYVSLLSKIKPVKFYTATFVIVLLIILATSVIISMYNMIMTFAAIMILLPIGYVFRNHNTMPIIITFMLYEQIYMNFNRMLIIHGV